MVIGKGQPPTLQDWLSTRKPSRTSLHYAEEQTNSSEGLPTRRADSHTAADQERGEKSEKAYSYHPRNEAQPRQISSSHLHTYPPLQNLLPGKGWGNDIIISSFGMDCYRPRYAGNSARGVIYEALVLPPSPATQLQPSL